MTKYSKTKADGKPFAPTINGYRLFREDDGTPYFIWVGKKNDKEGE